MSEFVWQPLDGEDVDILEDPNSTVTPLLGVKKSIAIDDESAEILTSGPIFDKAAEVVDLIQPYVKKDGGEVTLIGVRDGWVQLKFGGACGDCGSSSMTLLEIEESICEEIPDAKGVEVIQD